MNKVYTKLDEEGMLKELRARGPITLSVLPGSTLHNYYGGVIKKEETNLLEINSVSHNKMADYNHEWEEVEHAVLLIGYG